MIPLAVVADDAALLAVGAGSPVMSRLIVFTLADPRRRIFAPAMCVAAAIAQRPLLGDHIGSLDAIEVLELGFPDAKTAGEAISAGVEWGQANAVAAALPSVEWPAGLPVITNAPGSYRRHGIQVIVLP